VTPEVTEFLERLKSKAVVGIVGGSDLVKQKEQLGEDITHRADYSFSGSVAYFNITRHNCCAVENGLVAYRNGELIGIQVR
jgi:phosphomannomutase